MVERLTLYRAECKQDKTCHLSAESIDIWDVTRVTNRIEPSCLEHPTINDINYMTERRGGGRGGGRRGNCNLFHGISNVSNPGYISRVGLFVLYRQCESWNKADSFQQQWCLYNTITVYMCTCTSYYSTCKSNFFTLPHTAPPEWELTSHLPYTRERHVTNNLFGNSLIGELCVASFPDCFPPCMWPGNETSIAIVCPTYASLIPRPHARKKAVWEWDYTLISQWWLMRTLPQLYHIDSLDAGMGDFCLFFCNLGDQVNTPLNGRVLLSSPKAKGLTTS